MYFRQLADLTLEHWRTHLRDYLDDQEENLGVKLKSPISFTRASYVGGIWTPKTVPHYAIDVTRKELSDTGESLNTYNYTGQITGIIGAQNADASDIFVSGHEAACEKFIADHLHLSSSDPNFSLQAFAMIDADFSGALQADKNPRSPFWVHAFRIGLAWLVSEDAPRQHDA